MNSPVGSIFCVCWALAVIDDYSSAALEYELNTPWIEPKVIPRPWIKDLKIVFFLLKIFLSHKERRPEWNIGIELKADILKFP